MQTVQTERVTGPVRLTHTERPHTTINTHRRSRPALGCGLRHTTAPLILVARPLLPLPPAAWDDDTAAAEAASGADN